MNKKQISYGRITNLASDEMFGMIDTIGTLTDITTIYDGIL